MAGGHLDQAGRDWTDASKAAAAAKRQAEASAGVRVEQGRLLMFGRPETIKAKLEPIEKHVWPLRRQPDGSWAGRGVRYYALCFCDLDRVPPEQEIMAYGAAGLWVDPAQSTASASPSKSGGKSFSASDEENCLQWFLAQCKTGRRQKNDLWKDEAGKIFSGLSGNAWDRIWSAAAKLGMKPSKVGRPPNKKSPFTD